MYLAPKVQGTVTAPWKYLSYMHLTGFCSCRLKPPVGVASLPPVAVCHLWLSPVMSVGREVWDLQHLGVRLILLLIEAHPLLLITNGSNLRERRSSEGLDELWHGGCHSQDVQPPGVCRAGQTQLCPPHGQIIGSCTHTLSLSPGDMAPAIPAKVRTRRMKSLGTNLPGLANRGRGPPTPSCHSSWRKEQAQALHREGLVAALGARPAGQVKRATRGDTMTACQPGKP